MPKPGHIGLPPGLANTQIMPISGIKRSLLISRQQQKKLVSRILQRELTRRCTLEVQHKDLPTKSPQTQVHIPLDTLSTAQPFCLYSVRFRRQRKESLPPYTRYI